MRQARYAAASRDWLATWRDMYDAERAQGEAATDPAFRNASNQADHWDGQAERFAQSVARLQQPDGFMRFLLPRLRPADTLLDIGAGVGRYEPYLEQHVAAVTALEPSAAMRRHLTRRSGPKTRIAAAGWPPAGAVPPELFEPCDIVIAAHVLYSVREIEAFLTHMDAAARRGCYLLLSYRHTMSYANPFWEQIHGQERLPLPGALECLAALYQIGIPAQLTLVPIDNYLRFVDEEEALADIRTRLRISPDPRRDEQIRALIRSTFERHPDGSLVPPGLPQQSAVVWWERL